jgi:hypothetical protein
MNWNIILDDVSPALPLLGYQYYSRFHPVTFPSRAANLYFFCGLTTGGVALDLSLNLNSPVASLANLLYWGAFTFGLSAFVDKQNIEGDSSLNHNFEIQQNDSSETIHKHAQPVVNVRYGSR